MWRLNPQSSLHYRHWDHEWVVFDEASGQTHEMDTIAAAAVMQCEGGWVSLSNIAQGVMADLELPEDTDLIDRLTPLLRQFTDLGLLEHRSE